MSHNSLDSMIDEVIKKKDSMFVKARHKHSVVCIETPIGEKYTLHPLKVDYKGMGLWHPNLDKSM